MKQDLYIKNGITIPEHELEITTSRSGGAGGQHVNKTNTRVTVRWNVKQSHALSDEQKERILHKLQSEVTSEGDILVHHSSTRSQFENKKRALSSLADKIRGALHIAKKRMATKVSSQAKEKRLREKTRRSYLKKMRKANFD